MMPRPCAGATLDAPTANGASEEESVPQAGWYQDPASPTAMRWWDGRSWSSTVRPWGFAWAVGGWFIPIVNLWFPYQSAVDLFPPGHPGRAKVNRWWGLWLVDRVHAGLLGR